MVVLKTIDHTKTKPKEEEKNDMTRLALKAGHTSRLRAVTVPYKTEINKKIDQSKKYKYTHIVSSGKRGDNRHTPSYSNSNSTRKRHVPPRIAKRLRTPQDKERRGLTRNGPSIPSDYICRDGWNDKNRQIVQERRSPRDDDDEHDAKVRGTRTMR